MKATFRVNVSGLKKAAVCLAFFGLLAAKEVWALGLPPLITVPPLGLSVQNGGTAILTATVGLSLSHLEIQWQLNGKKITRGTVSTLTVPILGTTVTTLTIPNISDADKGNYTIKAENGAGETTSGSGLLIVLGDTVSNLLTTVSILTSGTGMTNGGFQLNLIKPATSNCVIEASTDLTNWAPIYTNSAVSTNCSYLDTAATSLKFRYYRARLK
jgi:hypothetical protein